MTVPSSPSPSVSGATAGRDALREALMKALGDTTCDHAAEYGMAVCLNCETDAVLAALDGLPDTPGERRYRRCDHLDAHIDGCRHEFCVCGRAAKPFPDEGRLRPEVCTDPDCTIPRKPGRPMHGPHDFRAAPPRSTE